MKLIRLFSIFLIFSILCFLNAENINNSTKGKIIYISCDYEIPFWKIMSKGMQSVIDANGFKLEVYSSQNNPKKELESVVKAVKEKASGIIISPSNSSAAVTMLSIAKNANIPVVIADIGSDGGEYLSYISSKNKAGAYSIGKLLTKKMIEKGWQNGKVGIIAIPQKRINGQERTAGFMKALGEHNIKGADIKQMIKWTDEETYNFTKEFIQNFPDLKALWLQTSSNYKGALKAIKDLKKEKELILVTYDAEPEFINLIKENVIIGSAMQQPYIMGKEAAKALINHLEGKKVKKNIQVSILTITNNNITENLITIEHNVLGIE